MVKLVNTIVVSLLLGSMTILHGAPAVK